MSKSSPLFSRKFGPFFIPISRMSVCFKNPRILTLYTYLTHLSFTPSLSLPLPSLLSLSHSTSLSISQLDYIPFSRYKRFTSLSLSLSITHTTSLSLSNTHTKTPSLYHRHQNQSTSLSLYHTNQLSFSLSLYRYWISLLFFNYIRFWRTHQRDFALYRWYGPSPASFCIFLFRQATFNRDSN